MVESRVSGIFEAIERTSLLVFFDRERRIVEANSRFLDLFGYPPERLYGQFHHILCSAKDIASTAYQERWAALCRGESARADVACFAADGRAIWLRADYAPTCDGAGAITGFVMMASDISQERADAAVNRSRLAAIDRSQLVIEFDLQGMVLDANDNFLGASGYDRAQIVGRHHSIFCPPGTAETEAYRRFWQKLRRGEYDSGEYRRIARDGRSIWLRAT